MTIERTKKYEEKKNRSKPFFSSSIGKRRGGDLIAWLSSSVFKYDMYISIITAILSSCHNERLINDRFHSGDLITFDMQSIRTGVK
jgi:hypothetical protein